MPIELTASAERWLGDLEQADPQRWRRVMRRLVWAEVNGLLAAGSRPLTSNRWWSPELNVTLVCSTKEGRLVRLFGFDEPLV